MRRIHALTGLLAALPALLLSACGGGVAEAIATLITAEFSPTPLAVQAGHTQSVALTIRCDADALDTPFGRLDVQVRLDPEHHLPAGVTASIDDHTPNADGWVSVGCIGDTGDPALHQRVLTLTISATVDASVGASMLTAQLQVEPEFSGEPPKDTARADLAINVAGVASAAPVAAETLQQEVDRLFPYVPDQPIQVTFVCRRANSTLSYYFDLLPTGRFNAFFVNDAYRQLSFTGGYTHRGGVLHLQAPDNTVMLLDESSNRIVPRLGMVGEFSTPNMSCVAIGHGDNEASAGLPLAYGCPLIRAGAASDERNALELNHPASIVGHALFGGIFRQREVTTHADSQTNTTRANGIFRRLGDSLYADFGSQFSDANLLKGHFGTGDTQLVIDQLEPAAGPCTPR